MGNVRATIVLFRDVEARTAEEQLLDLRRQLEGQGFLVASATTGIAHGTIMGYRSGCKCDLCREANALHCAEWRLKKRRGRTD